MPTLIFRGTDGREQRAELSSELSVGREAGNDVVLSEQGVSRRHCRFFLDEGGAVWVEDLGSANGVIVSGARIGEPARLTAGTEVGVGGCVVKLAAARRATSARVPAGNGARSGPRQSVALARSPSGGGVPGKRATRMMAAGEAPVRARPIARAPPPREMRPVLRGLAGPFQGQTFQLDRAKLTVGRVPPADVMLEDDSVSRRHAEIVKTGQKFSVRDLGSANGTFLNGDRVSEAPSSRATSSASASSSSPSPGRGRPAPPRGRAAPARRSWRSSAAARRCCSWCWWSPSSAAAARRRAPARAAAAHRPAPGRGRRQQADGQVPGLLRPGVLGVQPGELREVLLQGARRRPDAGRRQEGQDLQARPRQREAAQGRQAAHRHRPEEEGIKVLVKIEKDAVAIFPRAKAAFTEAAGILVKKNKNACKGDVNGGFFEIGYGQSCRRALELTCNRDEGPDEEALKYFQHAARNLGKGKGEYKCPPEYAKFQKLTDPDSLASDPRIKAAAAIRAKYANPKVAEVLDHLLPHGPAQAAVQRAQERASRASPRDREHTTTSSCGWTSSTGR
jgi:pSer/pThr/pTyr-binding forkhead associated (FHA) protein